MNNNSKNKYLIQEDVNSNNEVTEALKPSTDIELNGFDSLDDAEVVNEKPNKARQSRHYVKYIVVVVLVLLVIALFVGVGYSICCTGETLKTLGTKPPRPTPPTTPWMRTKNTTEQSVSVTTSLSPINVTTTAPQHNTSGISDIKTTHIPITSLPYSTLSHTSTESSKYTSSAYTGSDLTKSPESTSPLNQTTIVTTFESKSSSEAKTTLSPTETGKPLTLSSTQIDIDLLVSTSELPVTKIDTPLETISDTPFTSIPDKQTTPSISTSRTSPFQDTQYHTSSTSSYTTVNPSFSTGDDVTTEPPVTLSTQTPIDEGWPITYGINLHSSTLHASGSFRAGQASDTHSCDRVRDAPSTLRDPKVFYPEGISDFYQKYTEVYGIPIVGSANTTDAGLRRACYVVRYMLASRYDIRNAVYKFFGRVAIIGDDEQQTDLWEYRTLNSDYWDSRARGLGPKLYTPLTSIGDDNLRCHKQDRYPKEDILIHEFGHAVHILGARWVIPGFEDRLQQLYNTAMDQGKYKKKYMATNHKEYFAQASEIYLGMFNVSTAYPNGTAIVLHDRHTLQQYDPALTQLLSEVFPCENHFIDRCDWKNETRCNVNTFKKLHDSSEGLTSKCAVEETHFDITLEECALKACKAEVPVFLYISIVCRLMACSSSSTEDLMLEKSAKYNIYGLHSPVTLDTKLENNQDLQQLCTRPLEVPGMCEVPAADRVQCGPTQQTVSQCHARGCCFNNNICYYSKITENCLDQYDWCPTKAAAGECDTNQERMHAVCKLSCNICVNITFSTTASISSPFETTEMTTTERFEQEPSTEPSTTKRTEDVITTEAIEQMSWPTTMGANLDLTGNHPAGRMREGQATDSDSCHYVRSVPEELRNNSVIYLEGINIFYQKYTEAYGIPVVGSENVTDEGLMRACYTLRFMLAHRYDVRNSVYKFYGRIGVIADDEENTSLWEYRTFDAQYWNSRARGLGPTLYIPMSSVGDENQRCSPKDTRYPFSDILVHEFAHFVDQLGARVVVPGFTLRLKSIYDTVRSKGMYNNSYMGSNVNEFWAVGTEIFFSSYWHNDMIYEINGTMVALRDKRTLRMYDPDLSDLLEEIYPCPDSFIHRCDYKKAPYCTMSNNYKLLYPKAWGQSPNCGYDGSYKNIPTLEECALKACEKLKTVFTYDKDSKNCKLSKCPHDGIKLRASNRYAVDMYIVVTIPKAGIIELNHTIEQMCTKPVDDPNICKLTARNPCGPVNQTSSQCQRRGCCMINGQCVYSKSSDCVNRNIHCTSWTLNGNCVTYKAFMRSSCPVGCNNGICKSILSRG